MTRRAPLAPPMTSGRLSPARHALLVLHERSVEWCEFQGAELCTLRVACDAEVLSDVVRAAREARAQLQSRRRDLVVALGPERCELRVVELPALAARDQRAVLRRRAAAALNAAPEELCFAARGAPAHAGWRWLLAAVRRPALEALVAEFERAGLRVRRVVSEGLLGLPPGAFEGDPDAVGLSLVSRDGGALVWLGGPAGALHVGHVRAREPALLRAALLQEAQSAVAFARRALRGREVQELRLEGWSADETARLEAELGAVLPGLRLVSTPAESCQRRRLQRALAPELGALELTPAASLRPRAAAVAIVGALLLSLSAVAWTRAQWNTLTEQRVRELGHLASPPVPAAGAHPGGAGEAPATLGVEARLARLDRRLAEHEAAHRDSQAWSALLDEVATVLGEEVELRAIEGDPARHVTLQGRVDGRPLVALQALQAARARLGQTAGWRELALELAPATPDEPRRGLRWEWSRAP